MHYYEQKGHKDQRTTQKMAPKIDNSQQESKGDHLFIVTTKAALLGWSKKVIPGFYMSVLPAS